MKSPKKSKTILTLKLSKKLFKQLLAFTKEVNPDCTLTLASVFILEEFLKMVKENKLEVASVKKAAAKKGKGIKNVVPLIVKLDKKNLKH